MTFRGFAAALLFLPIAALADDASPPNTVHMNSAHMDAVHIDAAHMMDAAHMNHAGVSAEQSMHEEHAGGSPASSVPVQPGEAAFGAIAEVVSILMADPDTDWSKVDIDLLRRHLVDMDNVMLRAEAHSVAVEGGLRFDVTGEGAVRDSIRRMVSAHAAMMDGFEGWRFTAQEIEGGETLTVRAPPADSTKLKGLGFFGVLTLGMHHQHHHLMIARGVKLDP